MTGGTKLALTITGVAIVLGVTIKVARAAGKGKPWILYASETDDGTWFWKAQRPTEFSGDEFLDAREIPTVSMGPAFFPSEELALAAGRIYITGVLKEEVAP